MRQRFIALAAAIWIMAMPAAAMAVDKIDESKIVDGRLEGFGRPLTLDGGGSALVWLLLVAISAIGLGVLFKHAKRSHLD